MQSDAEETVAVNVASPSDPVALATSIVQFFPALQSFKLALLDAP